MKVSPTNNGQLSRDELEALRLTALDLTSELNVDQLLEMIIKRSRELLKADGGGIYLLNEGDQTLRVTYYSGKGPSMLGNTLRLGEGLVGEVVEQDTEIRVENYSAWDKRSPVYEGTTYRAVIGVPLTTPTKKMGALYMVNYEEGKVFDDRDALVLRVLASHAAIALANAAEFHRHEVILKQLQLINQLNEKLRHAVDINDILQITLEESLKAVGANEGSVMMLDEKTSEIEIRAWLIRGQKTDAKGHKRFRRDEGVAGFVARTGKPYNCPDTSNSEFFVPSFTKRRIQSLLSVPIILHHRVFCIINADSEDKNAFSDEDTDMLMALAGHVAIAIESQVLRDIGLSLATLPLEELYSQIVKNAVTLTGSDVGTIFLLNEGTNQIRRVALFPSTLEVGEVAVRDDGLTRQVLSTGEPLNLSGSEFQSLVNPAIRERSAKSLLAAPLNVRIENGRKTIGVLFVTTGLFHHYDKHDQELLQSLASQAAVSIERTRNFTELQENVLFVKSLLESALDAIVAVDEDGKIVLCNPSARKILNCVTEKEVLGCDAREFFLHPHEAEHVITTLRDTHRIVNYRADVKSRTGVAIPVRLSAVKLEKGSVGFFQDRRELESARRHVKQFKQLMEAEQAMNALSDEREVHRTVVEETIKTLSADVVCLYYYDQMKERMHTQPIAAGTLPSGTSPEDAFSISMVEKLLRTGDIYFAPTVHSDELLTGYPIPTEISSFVACPLKVRNRIVGVIFCCYFAFEPFNDEEQIAMMKLYFNGVANAIDNARLYEEVQQRATAMQGFYRASMLHFVNSDLNQQLGSVLDQVVRVTNVEWASMDIPIAPEGRPIFILHGKDTDAIKSKLIVPIESDGREVGKLCIANKRKADFTAEDNDYLQMLAATAGGIIERASLREQAAAVQSIDVAFVLLSVWNRMVKEKMRSVRDLLAKGAATERAPEILAELSAALEGIASFDPGAHSVEKDRDQRVDVSRILNQTASQVRSRLEAAAVAADGSRAGVLLLDNIQPNCEVPGNKLLLEFAFKILIDNAVAAIEQKGSLPVRLRVECYAQHHTVHISITDSGPGIDPEIKTKLFKVPLETSKTGSGYGCLTAGMIFKVHKSDIEVDSSEQGTHLKITMPRK